MKTQEEWLLDNIEEDFKVKVTMKPKQKKDDPQKYRDRLKRLNDMYLLGNISKEEYTAKSAVLQKQIAVSTLIRTGVWKIKGITIWQGQKKSLKSQIKRSPLKFQGFQPLNFRQFNTLLHSGVILAVIKKIIKK